MRDGSLQGVLCVALASDSMNYALLFCQGMLLGGAAALATACNPFAQTEDCYRGLSTGQLVEVELGPA